MVVDVAVMVANLVSQVDLVAVEVVDKQEELLLLYKVTMVVLVLAIKVLVAVVKVPLVEMLLVVWAQQVMVALVQTLGRLGYLQLHLG
jgi:hypothetical protein